MRPGTRRIMRLIHCFIVAALLLPPWLFGAVPAALGAGTLVVNTTDDTTGTAACSLRSAIQAANTHTHVDGCQAQAFSGNVTVSVPAGTYQLLAGGLSLTGDVTVIGAGAGVTIVKQTGSNSVFATAASGNATIAGLTITGGQGGNGGGIYNSGTLTLTAVRVTGNSATSGGGIYNDAGGIVTVTRSTIDNNGAATSGGGIASSSNGTPATLTVSESAIVRNSAGPGGGTTFSGGSFGGGVFNGGNSAVTITNTTISENRASDDGAGVYNNDGNIIAGTTNLISLVSVTISHNVSVSDAGGLDTFGPVNLRDTIIAQNTARVSSPDCRNPFNHPITSQGHNLLQNTSGCTITNLSPSDITGQDPRLGPLRDNGGPTLTRALGSGSPAIDAGNPVGTLNVDQRGSQRPVKGRADIGAYEFGGQINDSWLTAKEINAAAAISTETATIGLPGQSRWYKFKVTPNGKVTVQLTGLAANYDLTLYKDIGAAFGQLQSMPVTTTRDLLHLGAEFAPDAFSPDAFSPDAFSPDAFSPDAFSPDAFSPDAFSPDAFSPDAFSPDAFSGAQSRSLLAVSALEGTASEGIRANTWLSDGYFYVRVRGRNGASDPVNTFTLQTALFSGSCADANLVLGSASPIPPPAGDGTFQTLILTNTSRFQWGTDADRLSFLNTLHTFAGRADIKGQVIDFAGNAGLAALNAQSNRAVTCPYAKNLVATAIKGVIDSRWAANPALQYLVIAGDDDTIPFFRRPDQSLIGNERDFVPPVLDDTASQASLRNGYFLSQDGYAAATEVSLRSGTLPLPGLALGRLVETPTEITGQIESYIATGGIALKPSSSLVTGYDFLDDVAGAIEAEFQAGTGRAPDTLITKRGISPADPLAWTADGLRAALLGSRHDLIFLAGHFSASSALAADFNTRFLASELTDSPVDLTNSIIFSVGCHSGYNLVDDAAVAGVTQSPDWPQAAAQKRAILIAGTGYQYGDTDFIEYNERLYLAFSQQLRAGSSGQALAIGQVLVAAKQQYLTEVPSITGLHEKALLQATLFGLPMVKVDLPGRAAPSAPPALAVNPSPYSSGPGVALKLESADIRVGPKLQQQDVTLKDVTLSNAPKQATYFVGPQGVVTLPAQPVLPLSAGDVTFPGTALRGVGFRGGTYTDLQDILPLTGAPATEVRGVKPPFYSDVFFPVQPYRVNYLGALAGAGGNTQQLGPTQLMVTPAQYRSSNPGSLTGTLREFTGMDFRLYYNDQTTQNPQAALAAPPAIASVTDFVADDKLTVTVTTQGASAAGIQEVWLTYTATSGSFYGKWQSLDLIRDTLNPDLWTGTLDLQGIAPADLRYLVQAAGGTGLVTMLTNQGAYYTPAGAAGTTRAATSLTVSTAAPSGAFGSDVTVTLRGPANQPITIELGGQSRRVTTDGSGSGSATLRLLALPGTDYIVRASFGGTATLAPSTASQPFTITKQNTSIGLSVPALQAGDTATVSATLTDALGKPLGLKTIFVTASGGQVGTMAVVTDYTGRVTITYPHVTTSFTVTATFASGQGNQPADERYNASTAVVGVSVNHPPVASAGPNQTVDEGATVTLDAGASTDPDGDPLTYAWTVVSATGSAIALSSPTVARPTFQATDSGIYTLRVAVSDGKGGSATSELVITVRNVAPTVGLIGAPVGPVALGSAVTTSTLFTDPGTLDTHTATWNWGDGTPPSAGSVTKSNGSGTVAGSHQYTAAGVYTITLTVTDKDSGVGTSSFQYVVVYDPNGGFVSGGGWMDSPAGACRLTSACQGTTGRANFGFVSKYQQGATKPSGETAFHFKAGGLNFHSTSYEWLVVAGARAQYKGTGTINGQGDYGFLLTATDGQVTGGGGTDKFRIKIWDRATSAVVYDNVLDPTAADDLDNAKPQAIGGGSITIQK